MANYADTDELQRSILKLIATQGMMARKFFGRVDRDWMTTPQRKFIFDIAWKRFSESKTVLTDQIFNFEINTIGESEKSFYRSEWNFVKAINVNETPEVLIDLLSEVALARKATALVQTVTKHLQNGEIQEAVMAAKREAVMLDAKKEDLPVIELTDYQQRKDLILDKRSNPEKYQGIKTGFKTFDNLTGGLFKSEYILIAAVTGVGKSTIIKAIELGIITQNTGKNVLHITNEESRIQVEQKFDAISTEVPFSDFKRAAITDGDLEKWEDRMQELKGVDYGKIYIKELPAFTTVMEIERTFYELQQKNIKIDVIVIDLLNHLLPVQKSWTEHDERTKVSSDCKELAKSLNVPVLVAGQAASVVSQKQDNNKAAGRLDIYGSKMQIAPTNMFIIVTEDIRDQDQIQSGMPEYACDIFWNVSIKKNRDGPPFSFMAKHYVSHGSVKEVTDQERHNSPEIIIREKDGGEVDENRMKTPLEEQQEAREKELNEMTQGSDEEDEIDKNSPVYKIMEKIKLNQN